MKGNIVFAAGFLGLMIAIGLTEMSVDVNINVPGGVCVEETAPITTQPRHVF